MHHHTSPSCKNFESQQPVASQQAGDGACQDAAVCVDSSILNIFLLVRLLFCILTSETQTRNISESFRVEIPDETALIGEFILITG